MYAYYQLKGSIQRFLLDKISKCYKIVKNIVWFIFICQLHINSACWSVAAVNNWSGEKWFFHRSLLRPVLHPIQHNDPIRCISADFAAVLVLLLLFSRKTISMLILLSRLDLRVLKSIFCRRWSLTNNHVLKQ